MKTQTPTDVTLILEGTYPYVAGGVSTWVHQILGAYPDRSFALLHIGAHPEAYEKPLFAYRKQRHAKTRDFDAYSAQAHAHRGAQGPS